MQGESITVPVGGASGTYDVIWGDKTVSNDVTGDIPTRTPSSGASTLHSVEIVGGNQLNMTSADTKSCLYGPTLTV